MHPGEILSEASISTTAGGQIMTQFVPVPLKRY